MVKLGKNIGRVGFDVGEDAADVRWVDAMVAQERLREARLLAGGDELSDVAWADAMRGVAADLIGDSPADWSLVRVRAFWDEIMAEVDRLKKVGPGSSTPG